ncbi:MAG: VOC family protein [Pseudohongiellaceae bacterium]
MSLKLDHLVIQTTKLDESVNFYNTLLPLLGFSKTIEWEWENNDCLTVVLKAALEDVEYKRYGPGLNHFAFSVDSKEAFHKLYSKIEQAGLPLPKPQSFGESISVFIPDPDGLRLEIAWEMK